MAQLVGLRIDFPMTERCGFYVTERFSVPAYVERRVLGEDAIREVFAGFRAENRERFVACEPEDLGATYDYYQRLLTT